jgi:hypothetical protein
MCFLIFMVLSCVKSYPCFFQDLESPPSSVLAVMKNRWLSNGFKESALSTAIWGVLQAKRRMMVLSNGFKVSLK